MKPKELIELMKKEFPQYALSFTESSEHGHRVTFIAFVGNYMPELSGLADRCLAAVRSLISPDTHSYIHYDRGSSHTGVSVILDDYYDLKSPKI